MTQASPPAALPTPPPTRRAGTTQTSPLVEHLLSITPRLTRSINADVRHQKLSVPLTMGQWRTLYHLSSGYSTSGELAQHLTVTRPTISRLIDGLQRKGLVQRVASFSDRRQVQLELTESGRAVLREFQRKAGKRVQHLVDQLSHDEQQQLEQSLASLDRALLTSALGRPQ